MRAPASGPAPAAPACLSRGGNGGIREPATPSDAGGCGGDRLARSLIHLSEKRMNVFGDGELAEIGGAQHTVDAPAVFGQRQQDTAIDDRHAAMNADAARADRHALGYDTCEVVGDDMQQGVLRALAEALTLGRRRVGIAQIVADKSKA